MKFIDQVTELLFEEKYDFNHLTIVLPSERARKYLTTAIIKKHQKPIFAPEIITMDQWVKSYSPETVIDKTRALLQLFSIQLKTAKTEEDRSFDEFLTWGTILLSDFNEIDRYLLDANEVFKNLADIKEIEQWSFNNDELTESQKRFMEFWDRLPGYYKALNEVLSKNESCYAGKSFKVLAENIDLLFKVDKTRKFLFAGFNALSKAELTIIRQLEKMGRATVMMDADTFYLKDKNHEAGKFLRELSEKLDGKKLDFVGDRLATKSMNVELIECAQNTGQAKVAATILENSTSEQIDETLLLLADESLIGSVIKNLPKKIGKANITLGLPIRNTAMRTWVDLIFSIQENKKRFKTKWIYFNDLQNFWNHPFLLAILTKEEKDQLILAEAEIVKYNRIFINPDKLEIGTMAMSLLNELSKDWISDWKTAMTIVRRMSQLMFKHLGSEFAFEKAVIECFDRALIDFQNCVEEGIPEMSLKSFKHLFNQHWGMKSIAYHGNPTKGLQIMGLLETRAIDFKRIICVGMNEGNLPPVNPIQTMIPMDLRRYLGLPTPREKQGLFAHHFYRLLHHCEDLFVTYSTATEAIGSNEPSRYLMQLEMELSRVNKNIKISKKTYSLDVKREDEVMEITKTKEIKQRMDELFAQSTSASMLKKYLECPLDFYFRYVMDFGEQESVEEEIENSTFGSFIHETLEDLYTPFARFDKQGVKVDPAPTNITSFDVEKMLGEFKLVIYAKFMKHFNNDKEAFLKGKNYLSYQMAIYLTKRFLKSEVAFLAQQTEEVFIESLERKYEAEIEVEVLGEIKKLKLIGYIDRVDSIGDKIRIIDYKSGKVADEDVEFRSQDKDIEKTVGSLKSRKHVLQLLNYVFLYNFNHQVIAEPSIISFVSGQNKPFTLKTTGFDLQQMVEDFPVYLGEILNEIYNDEVAFTHEFGKMFSYCQYCE